MGVLGGGGALGGIAVLGRNAMIGALGGAAPGESPRMATGFTTTRPALFAQQGNLGPGGPLAIAQMQTDPGIRTTVCTSMQIHKAMQNLEALAVRDPNEAVLGKLANVFEDGADTVEEESFLDSKEGSDGGQYTSQVRGSFACRGLFVHGPTDLQALRGADGNQTLTAEKLHEITQTHHAYVELFMVAPLQGDIYRVSLLPSSAQRSRTASVEINVPGRLEKDWADAQSTPAPAGNIGRPNW